MSTADIYGVGGVLVRGNVIPVFHVPRVEGPFRVEHGVIEDLVDHVWVCIFPLAFVIYQQSRGGHRPRTASHHPERKFGRGETRSVVTDPGFHGTKKSVRESVGKIHVQIYVRFETMN